MTTYRTVFRGLIQTIEQVTGYSVLYAADAGSRARGLAGEASDHDVRFVYLPPAEWYYTVNRKRLSDSLDRLDWPRLGIEMPKEFDFAGMELTKFLGLVQASNPTTLEWLSSPLVYWTSPLGKSLPELLTLPCRRGAMVEAYASQARAQAHRRDWPDSATVKDWLMFLVPALSALVVFSTGRPPTLDFDALTQQVGWPIECEREAVKLAHAKRAGEGSRPVLKHEIVNLWAWADDFRLRSPKVDHRLEDPVSEAMINAIDGITRRASDGQR